MAAVANRPGKLALTPFLAAGHGRCIIALKPENIDAWLEPDPGHLSAMYAILDDPIDAYYQHELPEKKVANS